MMELPPIHRSPTPTADRALAWLRDPSGDIARTTAARVDRWLRSRPDAGRKTAGLSPTQADALRRAPCFDSGVAPTVPAAARRRDG
jgi:hypothetical protein